jgi:hypothetical protein
MAGALALVGTGESPRLGTAEPQSAPGTLVSQLHVICYVWNHGDISWGSEPRDNFLVPDAEWFSFFLGLLAGNLFPIYPKTVKEVLLVIRWKCSRDRPGRKHRDKGH